MTTDKGQQKFTRRTLLLYVALIALPAALFLYLSFQSVRRQWSQLLVVAAQDLPTAGRNLAGRVESRSQELATEVLRDNRLQQLQTLTLSARTPESARQLERFATEISQAHPFSRHIFVARRGAVQLPVMHAFPPRTPASVLKAEERNVAFAARLKQATREERSHPTGAAPIFASAAELAKANDVKALMLSRGARAYLAGGRRSQAAEYFRNLAQLHGDVYDLEHVPYGVSALIALFDIDPKHAESRALLQTAYAELLDGRWSVTNAQFQSLEHAMRTRLGDSAQPGAGNHGFADRMAMASALENALRSSRAERLGAVEGASGGSGAGAVHSLAFNSRDNSYQGFYLAQNDGVVVGFTVNMDWVDSTLLPELGSGTTFGIAPRNERAPAHTRVAFNKLYPQWDVVIAPASVRKTAAQMDVFVLVGSAVLMVLIAVGLTLVTRSVRSERDAAKMRIEFVNGVSHELKTPITLVKLYAETLLSDPSLRSDQRECCDVILQESERLTNLVEHILDYTRVDRGVRSYRLVPGDLAPVVEHLVRTCTRYLDHRGFTLAARIEPNLPPVSFDLESIPSLVLNLVDNAVKYSGNSRLVRIALYREGGEIVLEVQDHGIGIRKSDIDRIFEPYYRVNVNYSRGGCGLGLALVRNIMEAHRGRIEVASRVGEGTRFRLIFPQAAASLARNAATAK